MYIFENYSGDIENENGSGIIVGESSIDGILKNNTNYLADQRAKLSFNANPIEISLTYKRNHNCQTKFQNNKIIENKNNINNNVINNINDSGTVNLDENSENNNNSNAPNSNQNIIILMAFNNNSDSNSPATNFNDNSNKINNIPKNDNLPPNNNIRFKIENFIETCIRRKLNKLRKSRKYDDDLLIKKHKGKFFRYIREILNKILIKYNIKAKFNFFPKILKEGPEKNTFKKILELKLIEFINFEIMEKITYKKGQKKIQISKLKDKQDLKFQIILKDLHNEYLKTTQYKKEINELEQDYDNEYMDLYKKNAEGFINYFFEDKKIKKHKKLKP